MAVRSVGVAELDAAQLLRRSLSQPQTWPVGVYDFDGHTLADISVSDSQRRRYSPLQHRADLFLSFACLYESEDFARSALKWVYCYGLPTADPTAYPTADEKAPQSLRMEDLHAHAYRAWDTLVHYEACLHGEPHRALYLPTGEPNPVYKDGRNKEGLSGSEQEMLDLIAQGARGHARDRVTAEINGRCYLRPLDKDQEEYPAFEWVWGFEDLLGAMYLWMMVLMERGSLVGRCKQCGTAFSEKKAKAEHSPRRRVFCGNACRMAYKRAQ